MLKNTILQAAVRLAHKRSAYTLMRREIAHEAGAATGTVNYHWESVGNLRVAVIEHAIDNEVLGVLARVFGDPRVTRRLSPALKERVAAHIAGK